MKITESKLRKIIREEILKEISDEPDETPTDYEVCSRCGLDHEYDAQHAQQIHSKCPLCRKEREEGRFGEGPDHDCEEEIYKASLKYEPRA